MKAKSLIYNARIYTQFENLVVDSMAVRHGRVEAVGHNLHHAGEFRSRTEVLRTTLTPHQPRIYALLPYKVDEVVVEARVSPAGRRVTYDVALNRREARSPTEDHAVRLELDGPDGRNRPSYTTLMMVPAGQLIAQTRIGLEEPAGEWTIRVVDVVTGLEAEATFTLEEAQ